MTPDRAIAMLDRQLGAHGLPVALARSGGSPPRLDCNAFVREFKPDEIMGSINQGDRLAIFSPTDLEPAGWLRPEEGDRVQVDAGWSRVQAVNRKLIGATVVRVELHLRGM